MSEYIAHTETKSGVTLKIILDDHGGTESPISYDDAVIFAVLHRRYENPAEKYIATFDAEGESFNGEPVPVTYTYDFTSPEGIAKFESDMAALGDTAPYAVFPLFMYDHSGTSYRCSEGGNPFSCSWDSGRVEIIALKKSNVGTPGKVIEREGQEPFTIGSYFEQAQKTCETYTAWANGEIYGYVIEDANGEHLDSCWGFIEPEGAQGYVLEEGRSQLAYYVAQAEKMEARKTAIRATSFDDWKEDVANGQTSDFGWEDWVTHNAESEHDGLGVEI